MACDGILVVCVHEPETKRADSRVHGKQSFVRSRDRSSRRSDLLNRHVAQALMGWSPFLFLLPGASEQLGRPSKKEAGEKREVRGTTHRKIKKCSSATLPASHSRTTVAPKREKKATEQYASVLSRSRQRVRVPQLFH